MTEIKEEPEELIRFREEWRAEVRRNKEAQQRALQTDFHDRKPPPGANGFGTTTHGTSTVSIESHPRASSTNRGSHIDPAKLPPSVVRALEVYRRAVACEQRSEIDEALRLYRVAFRIEDNVARVYEQLLRVQDTNADKPAGTSTGAGVAPVSAKDIVNTVADGHIKRPSVDGIEQVTRALEGVLVSGSSCSSGAKVSASRNVMITLSSFVASWPMDISFDPEDEKEPVHIRILPEELLVKILRYLDTASLERFAVVNRKARAITLDRSIWRRHITSVYKPPQIPDDDDLIISLVEKYAGDPRRMFTEQPRIRLDGVYIAVCHYIRPGLGESAWISVSHLVTYHRYLRFYPTGQVISLLTNEDEDPQHTIPKLELSAREKSLYIGSWRLEGTTVLITDLLEVLGESPRYAFQMTLELKSRPMGRWNRLSLLAYETVAISDGEATPLPLKNERPFWFSKVRSFSA